MEYETSKELAAEEITGLLEHTLAMLLIIRKSTIMHKSRNDVVDALISMGQAALTKAREEK